MEGVPAEKKQMENICSPITDCCPQDLLSLISRNHAGLISTYGLITFKQGTRSLSVFIHIVIFSMEHKKYQQVSKLVLGLGFSSLKEKELNARLSGSINFDAVSLRFINFESDFLDP
jgi:hypothetical protein